MWKFAHDDALSTMTAVTPKPGPISLSHCHLSKSGNERKNKSGRVPNAGESRQHVQEWIDQLKPTGLSSALAAAPKEMG